MALAPQAHAVAPAGPLPVRLLAWIRERHGLDILPPVLLLYALGVVTGAAIARAHPPAGELALGAVGAWSWYLLLRILDDLGDAEDDAAGHPDRLLQRGVVTPADLRLLAGVSALLQAAICVVLDGGLGAVTASWLLALAFAGAAAADFGARDWLRDRPLLTRTLRAPASVLPVVWFSEIGAQGAAPTWATAALAVVAAAAVLLFDVARTWDRGEAGGVSWADQAGAPTARALLVALVALLALACAVLLDATGAATGAALAVLSAAALAGIAAALRTSATGALAAGFALLAVTLASLLAETL